jgi:double-stranded uracil-DNA glycosylase
MKQAVADLVGPDLRVLFCGINPGTLSVDLSLHFARQGNRFWKLLCAGGFTGSVLSPAEQHTLLGLGMGITNLVGRVMSRITPSTTSRSPRITGRSRARSSSETWMRPGWR